MVSGTERTVPYYPLLLLYINPVDIVCRGYCILPNELYLSANDDTPYTWQCKINSIHTA